MTPVFACLTAFTIVAGLWLDSHAGAWGQAVVNVWTWGLLCTMFVWAARRQRALWLACLAWAWFGEIVLSQVWGLYDYWLGGLPLFVPPGHVLLFALGMWLAERLPAALTDAVPAFATGLVLSFALLANDTLSLPLLAIFLLSTRFGPSPRLYSTMFLLALAMEFYGTALGNWAWRDQVPGLPLDAANPPLAAGAVYCLLDWLVGLSVRPVTASADRLHAPDSRSAGS